MYLQIILCLCGFSWICTEKFVSQRVCSQLRTNRVMHSPYCFRSHKCLLQYIFRATLLWFTLMIFCLKWPRHRAKAISCVSKWEEAVICLREVICVLDKLCSGITVIVLLALSSMLMNQQHKVRCLQTETYTYIYIWLHICI